MDTGTETANALGLAVLTALTDTGVEIKRSVYLHFLSYSCSSSMQENNERRDREDSTAPSRSRRQSVVRLWI